MVGKILSHYRITEKLGQGGMGEVYRAEDTNLSRQVAIKVLPDEFAHDAERLARFEREAKLLASLNHPNIAAIHGLEEHEGKPFLVLELVEGQTLSERLKKGRIPLDETLDICRQIAEGLEAAHEKGIIHRDLKPANLKITPEGKVKILDFGLAKAFQAETSAPDVSKSPTLTSQMTRAGVILGTAAYMSPEQTKGKGVDKRADIWAFGCVLFECLTGNRAFEGETLSETMASILKGEPDWQAIPAFTPPKVKDLLRRCLEKDPKERIHDIADVRIEIQAKMGLPAEAVPALRRLPLRWVGVIAAVALVGGIMIGLAVKKSPQLTAPFPLVASTIKLEPGYCLSGMGGGGRTDSYGWDHPTRTGIALSSNGRFIVYSAIKESAGPQDGPRLYLRRIHELGAKPIPETEGGISPFLSPDDRWIGFWAGGKLIKVSVDGGVPATLCDVAVPFGFSWGSDNQIVFASEENTGLSRVSAVGGKPETLTIPDKSKEEYSHRLPHCLPNGKGILLTITKKARDMHPHVSVLEPATGKWRVLLEDAADARYTPTGHLVFLRQGTLMAAPFDLSRLEVTGPPVPATANVMQALNMGYTGMNTGAGQFGISASGSLAYASGGILPDPENSLVWVDQKGRSEPITSFKAPFFAPRLSPDGQQIVYRTLGKDRQVWIYDLNRGTATRLTNEGEAGYVTWTREGQRVVFNWSKALDSNLYWQPADGSKPMERLTTSEGYLSAGSFSPDGETLAFVYESPDSVNINLDIQLLRMRDRRVTPFLNSRFEELCPEFSPDGRWIAYVSDESGRFEVYVQPFPGLGGKWQISSKGGDLLLWSPNGKQLFYRWEDQIWAVDVQARTGFSVSKPRLLFEQPGYGWGYPIRSWDISLDGKRFLMVKMEERKPQPVTEMILVQNWFEELKRLCPTGK
jgi:serine/threonine-protein kinase